MTTPEPASDETRRKTCAAADFRPARPQPRISGGEPIPDSSERAGDRAAADSDHRAGALLVGLRPADGDP